jgi:hypothetical protein
VTQYLADYFQICAGINLSARVTMTKNVSSHLRETPARFAYRRRRWRMAPLVIGA